jgi:glutaredoxin 3
MMWALLLATTGLAPDELAVAHRGSTLVKRQVQEHNCVIFAKSYCPYSVAAKNVLIKVGARCIVFDLDRRIDGRDMQLGLRAVTGVHTVPQIFIGHKSVGGSSDVVALYSTGKLDSLVVQAGAIMHAEPPCKGTLSTRIQKEGAPEPALFSAVSVPPFANESVYVANMLRANPCILWSTTWCDNVLVDEMGAIQSGCEPRSVEVKNALLQLGAKCNVVDFNDNWEDKGRDRIVFYPPTSAHVGDDDAYDPTDHALSFLYRPAEFGPKLQSTPDQASRSLEAPLAVSQPFNGCARELTEGAPAAVLAMLKTAHSKTSAMSSEATHSMGLNATNVQGALAGKVLLVQRGGCKFLDKVLNGQRAGAVAVVVVNNIAAPPKGVRLDHSQMRNAKWKLVSMSASVVDEAKVQVPSVFTSLEAGMKMVQGIAEWGAGQKAEQKAEQKAGHRRRLTGADGGGADGGGADGGGADGGGIRVMIEHHQGGQVRAAISAITNRSAIPNLCLCGQNVDVEWVLAMASMTSKQAQAQQQRNHAPALQQLLVRAGAFHPNATVVASTFVCKMSNSSSNRSSGRNQTVGGDSGTSAPTEVLSAKPTAVPTTKPRATLETAHPLLVAAVPAAGLVAAPSVKVPVPAPSVKVPVPANIRSRIAEMRARDRGKAAVDSAVLRKQISYHTPPAAKNSAANHSKHIDMPDSSSEEENWIAYPLMLLLFSPMICVSYYMCKVFCSGNDGPPPRRKPYKAVPMVSQSNSNHDPFFDFDNEAEAKGEVGQPEEPQQMQREGGADLEALEAAAGADAAAQISMHATAAVVACEQKQRLETSLKDDGSHEDEISLDEVPNELPAVP